MFRWIIFSSCLSVFIIFQRGANATAVGCGNLNIAQIIKINETDDEGYIIYNTSATIGKVQFQVTNLNNPTIYEYFIFEANTLYTALYLNKTLDLEELNVLGLQSPTLTTTTTCTEVSSTTYNLMIYIEPVNEFPPHFIGEPFNVSIGEETLVDSIVFSFDGKVDDADFDTQSKTFHFEIHPYELSSIDGQQYFYVPYVTKGDIALKKEVDFEALQETGYTYFMLNVSAEDNGGLFTTTTLNISMYNTDDLGPAFTLPACNNEHTQTCSGYTSSVDYTYTGHLDVKPIAIEAVDLDKLGANIIYSISLVTPPEYKTHFTIDAKTGAISVTSPLKDADTVVFIYIQATEDTPKRNASTAYIALTIQRPGVTDVPPGGSTNMGQSTEKSSISWTVFGVVLGACFVLLIVVAIIAFCVSKRFRTPISPGGLDSEEKISHDEIHSRTSSTWPPSRPNSKQELINNEYLTPMSIGTPIKSTQLPPISHQDKQEMQAPPRRPTRKKKKKPPEVYDGTQTYEGQADPEFYEDGMKKKIKRSPRSFENEDPKYWIKVPYNN